MGDVARSGPIGCGKIAGYGCLGAIVLGVVAGVGIWASWDLLRGSGVGKGLRETVETVKAEGAALQLVRQRLLADYPAADVVPHVQVNSQNGVTVKTLQITIVDPTFALPESDEARLAQAREIARAAAAAHPGVRRYDLLRLVVERHARGAVAATSTATYDFPTAEL
jgi:hypothetical protein